MVFAVAFWVHSSSKLKTNLQDISCRASFFGGSFSPLALDSIALYTSMGILMLSFPPRSTWVPLVMALLAELDSACVGTARSAAVVSGHRAFIRRARYAKDASNFLSMLTSCCRSSFTSWCETTMSSNFLRFPSAKKSDYNPKKKSRNICKKL